MGVLTVVSGAGLLKAESAPLVAETGESSCNSPLLSKTLEGETRQSVTNCALLITHRTKGLSETHLSQAPTQDCMTMWSTAEVLTLGMSTHTEPHSSF